MINTAKVCMDQVYGSADACEYAATVWCTHMYDY